MRLYGLLGVKHIFVCKACGKLGAIQGGTSQSQGGKPPPPPPTLKETLPATWRLAGNVVPGMGSNWNYLSFTCWVTEKTQRFTCQNEILFCGILKQLFQDYWSIEAEFFWLNRVWKNWYSRAWKGIKIYKQVLIDTLSLQNKFESCNVSTINLQFSSLMHLKNIVIWQLKRCNNEFVCQTLPHWTCTMPEQQPPLF